MISLVRLSGLALLASALLFMTGCGGSDSDGDNNPAPGTDATSTDTWTPATVDPSGSEPDTSETTPTAVTDSAEPVDGECTEDGEICITLKMPAELAAEPLSLVIAFYESLPPMTPPSIFPPFQVADEALTALGLTGGMEHTFKMPGITDTGDYFVYVVLYMPDGGLATWQPLAGTDYVTESAEPITLTGQALNIDGVWELTLAE